MTATEKKYAFGYVTFTKPDPFEAAALMRAATDLLAGTATLGQIAARWNRHGPARPFAPGTPWDAATVSRVLQEPRLAGLLVRDGKVVAEPAPWTAIFTVTMRNALLVILPRDFRNDPAHNRTTLAARIAVCGVCGQVLDYNAGPRRKPSRQRYICATTMRPGPKDDRRHVQIARTILDARIRVAIVGLLTRHPSVLGYEPRDLTSLALLLGAASAAGDRAEVAVLTGERDDALLARALKRVAGDDERTVADRWDELTLTDKIRIVSRLLRIEVALGRGTERVHIQDLLT